MKEATTNNTSSNAVKSVKKDKEKTSGDEQKNVDAKADAASKKIVQEKIEDKAAEDIHNEEVSDIITIIGKDKNITAEQVADKAGTITNELLCRLGGRLEKVVV